MPEPGITPHDRGHAPPVLVIDRDGQGELNVLRLHERKEPFAGGLDVAVDVGLSAIDMEKDLVDAGAFDGAEEGRAVGIEETKAVRQELAVEATALDQGDDPGKIGMEGRLAAQDGHGLDPPQGHGPVEVPRDLIEGLHPAPVDIVAAAAVHVAGPVDLQGDVRDVPGGEFQQRGPQARAEVGDRHGRIVLSRRQGVRDSRSGARGPGLATAGCWRRR